MLVLQYPFNKAVGIGGRQKIKVKKSVFIFSLRKLLALRTNINSRRNIYSGIYNGIYGGLQTSKEIRVVQKWFLQAMNFSMK